jgi:protein-S-isoprenylcysteine O-methyltransferase Ste14
MLKRSLFFTYGVISYLIFFGSFLYAIGFIGNLPGMPTALDAEPAGGSLGVALTTNLALLGAFAVQHSVMARQWFKARWTRIIPAPLERSTYVLISSLLLIALFIWWQPIGITIWSVEHQATRAALYAVFGLGFAIVLISTFLINHFDLFGLRQVSLALRGKDYTPLRFRTPFLYRVVRHPLYFGWVLPFWVTPTMTLAHLAFAVATTLYMLIAIQFEERDLVREHRDLYRDYQRRVPMLIPALKRTGVAGLAFFTLKGLLWLAIPAIAALSH